MPEKTQTERLMKILLIFLLCSLRAHAGLILHLGPSAVTGLESEGKALNGKDRIDAEGTLGYVFGIEYPMLRNYLSIHLTHIYSKMEAKTQYFDKNTGIQADDQKSWLSNNDTMLGLRFRVLNTRHLKLFLGGGGLIGNAKLRHDTSNYEEQNGPVPASFKDVEKAQKSGNFLDAGAEIIFTKNSGLRLMGQLVNSQTQTFDTLNHKVIKGSYTAWSVEYIHYFEKILPK